MMKRKSLVGLLMGTGAIAALAFAVPANASPVADSHAASHAVTNAQHAQRIDAKRSYDPEDVLTLTSDAF